MSLKTFFGNAIANLRFNFNKNKPGIYMAAGIGALVGGTVSACIATIKVKEVVDEAKVELKEKEAELNRPDISPEEEKAIKKEGKKIILKTGAKVLGLYSPAIGLSAVGTTLLVKSNGIQNTRIAQGAAAASAASALAEKYRKALIEAAGEDADEDLRLGGHREKRLVEKLDKETGELKEEEEEIVVTDPNLVGSPYAFYFDETTSDIFPSIKEISRDDEIFMAMKIVQGKESYFNDILRARNYGKDRQPVWLSEILDEFRMKHAGIPRYDERGNVVDYDIDIAQACGNVYDPENSKISNCIDFRAKVVFIPDGNGGLKKTIVLDPNVDGCVIGYKYVGR